MPIVLIVLGILCLIVTRVTVRLIDGGVKVRIVRCGDKLIFRECNNLEFSEPCRQCEPHAPALPCFLSNSRPIAALCAHRWRCDQRRAGCNCPAGAECAKDEEESLSAIAFERIAVDFERLGRRKHLNTTPSKNVA